MLTSNSVYRCALKDASNFTFATHIRSTKGFYTTVLFCFFGFAPADSASAQVHERASRWIRDVAKVTLDSSGKSTITYNPAICRKLGPALCEFFRAHEYGHVNLQHLERGVPVRRAEVEADVWAATHASPTAVAAALRYFNNGNGGSKNHGSSQERAQRIMQAQANTSQRVVVRRPNYPPQTSPTKVLPQPDRRPANQYAGGAGRVMARYKAAPTKTSTQTQTQKKIYYYIPTPRRTTSGYIPRGGFNAPR